MQVYRFLAVIFFSNAVLVLLSLHNQFEMTSSLAAIKHSLDLFSKQQESIVKASENITQTHRSIREETGFLSSKTRHLLEVSRRNYLRIKGIPEKTNENIEEKIVQMASFLGLKISTSDIERANRIGKKQYGKERTIVTEFSNHKLKQQLMRKASEVAASIEFIVSDDAANYMAQVPVLQDSATNKSRGCGLVTSVAHPVTHGKSETVFGAWMKDSSDDSNGYIWVMRHFFDNRVVEEYASIRDVARWRPRTTYKLPYEWSGTGHVVWKNSLYFNKSNSSLLVKFDFESKAVKAEKNLPEAVFSNKAPYQWSGETDIDLAVDETGLWAIYATMDNALDIVISRLDPDSLEVRDTWSTNLRKQWSGNAFMICGVLYVMKKYNEAKTSLSYMYDTKNRFHKYIEIPFENPYEWNTMLAYNHKEKKLYAWDRGYLVTYEVRSSA